MMKKAAIEIQFHWIFVSIAGIMILGLFIFLVMRQQITYESRTSISIASDLRTILVGAQTATRTLNDLDIPQTKVKFECDLVGEQKIPYSIFSIGNHPEEIKSQVIFSPPEIDTSKLRAWSYDWSLPYKTNNFLFIAIPQERIILVEKSSQKSKSLCQMINKTLPEKLNIRYVQPNVPPSLTDLQDQNNQIETIIFCDFDPAINPSPSDVPSKLNPKYSRAISIKPTSDDLEKGTIRFFKATKTGYIPVEDEKSYAGSALIFGAIFSPEPIFFECNKKKALTRYHLVSDIYWKKTEALKGSISGDPNQIADCRDLYDQANRKLKNLADKSKNDLNEIYLDAKSIEAISDQLQRKSCPLIY
ncbi:MAG: hypothetical protein QW331_02565 [Candidatus Woesearchaeota archaeon]